MTSMAASAEDDDMRSEAPSTCGHWTASDDEDEEEEVVVVGDVATLLSHDENVKQVDVCESDVMAYETTLQQEHEAIEVESKAVDTGIAHEIDVEYEEMPQAQEAQDVVVPPSGGSVESVCANICKDLEKTMHHFADTLGVELVSNPPAPQQGEENMQEKQFEVGRIRFKDCSSHASGSSDTSGSSTATDTTVRKSTRNGKKRMEPDDPSDALQIIGQRATILQKFGTDFLVKKHDKPDSWWVHEDELRDSDAGCVAMEVFDKKFSDNKVSNNKRRRK